MKEASRENWKLGLSMVTTGAALVAVAVSAIATRDAARSVDISAESLEASQRAFQAQSQPQIGPVPIGERLDVPEFVEFWRTPVEINYPGEVLVAGVVDIEGVVRLSVPVENVGSGTALIDAASLTPESRGPISLLQQEAPLYVAPNQTVRLNREANTDFTRSPQFVLSLRYRDFAGETRWHTTIRYYVRGESWIAQPSTTVRVK